ncbi:hypothetical protein BJV78DRAFT_475619 [Lactifluus subvellereus]|nr:hypothetical protein BJV78DRAFT_475619 [Lactifluus subvellereus]
MSVRKVAAVWLGTRTAQALSRNARSEISSANSPHSHTRRCAAPYWWYQAPSPLGPADIPHRFCAQPKINSPTLYIGYMKKVDE